MREGGQHTRRNIAPIHTECEASWNRINEPHVDAAMNDKMPPIQSSNLMDNEDRPRCADCGEPVELADPDDLESWIHAVDANYFGDHTAWVGAEGGEGRRGVR